MLQVRELRHRVDDCWQNKRPADKAPAGHAPLCPGALPSLFVCQWSSTACRPVPEDISPPATRQLALPPAMLREHLPLSDQSNRQAGMSLLLLSIVGAGRKRQPDQTPGLQASSSDLLTISGRAVLHAGLASLLPPNTARSGLRLWTHGLPGHTGSGVAGRCFQRCRRVPALCTSEVCKHCSPGENDHRCGSPQRTHPSTRRIR